MGPVVSVFDTGAGPNPIRTDVTDTSWQEIIRQRDMPEIRSASDTRLSASETVTFHLWMDDSNTRVALGEVDKLAVPLPLGTTFIVRFMKSMHPTERKTILEHSPPVLIPMIQGTSSVAENSKFDIS